MATDALRLVPHRARRENPLDADFSAQATQIGLDSTAVAQLVNTSEAVNAR